eukprot:8283730-Lingulodinium_polyedra.AAC.1
MVRADAALPRRGTPWCHSASGTRIVAAPSDPVPLHGWSTECSHDLAAMRTAGMALWMELGRMAFASAGMDLAPTIRVTCMHTRENKVVPVGTTLAAE